MKPKYAVAALLLITLMILSGCASKPLSYIEKKSTMIGDFSVENESANVQCVIVIKNKSNSPVSFRMKGDFAEDQKLGLYEDRYVYASSGAVDVFSIDANSTKDFEVSFIGQSGGKELKKDRKPPNKIVFEIQDNE